LPDKEIKILAKEKPKKRFILIKKNKKAIKSYFSLYYPILNLISHNNSIIFKN